MISFDEVVNRIRISDLGRKNKWYADEVIEKYKIASNTRLKYPTLTEKWVIDNQRQIVDVNDRTIIIGGIGSPFFDKINFMIKTEAEVQQFLGSKYSSANRLTASRQTFWKRLDTRVLGNPKFSIHNREVQRKKKESDFEKMRIAEEKSRLEEINRLNKIKKIEEMKKIEEKNRRKEEKKIEKTKSKAIKSKVIRDNSDKTEIIEKSSLVGISILAVSILGYFVLKK